MQHGAPNTGLGRTVQRSSVSCLRSTELKHGGCIPSATWSDFNNSHSVNRCK